MLSTLIGGWNGTASRRTCARAPRANHGVRGCRHQQPAAGVAAGGELVDPGDSILVLGVCLLGQIEEFAEVAERRHRLVDVE